MHPRLSVHPKTPGLELLERLMSPCPALPVVDDDLQVIGVVTEYDVFTALREGKTIHEFSAESLTTCGHAEHGFYDTPETVTPNTTIEDIVDLFVSRDISILPVVDNGKLTGIVPRRFNEEAAKPPSNFKTTESRDPNTLFKGTHYARGCTICEVAYPSCANIC